MSASMIRSLNTALLLSVFAIASSSAFAGSPTPNLGATVTFGTPTAAPGGPGAPGAPGAPSAGAAAAAAAMQVPALSDGLLMGLGFLLAVAGVRVIKRRPSLRRPLAWALVGSGVTLTGLGVDSTMATSVIAVQPEQDICSGGQKTVSMSDVDLAGNRGSLLNSCESNELTILAYSLPCPQEQWIISNGDVGTVVQPSTEVELNRCPLP
jgi:hypothetical protein